MANNQIVEPVFPPLVTPADVNLLSVKINESYGILEQVALVEEDYQMRSNDRYIVTEQEITVTLANAQTGKVVSIRNNSSGNLTILGGNNTIGGSTGILLATDDTEHLLFTGEEWIWI